MLVSWNAGTTTSYGGWGGEFFSWYPQDSASVFSIRIWHGLYVDGFELTMRSVSQTGAILVDSPHFGGHGGRMSEWYPPSQITSFTIRSGDLVDQIQFHCNGQSSPKFGGEGGVAHTVDVGAGRIIQGVFGRDGPYINRLGFWTRN